MKRAVGKTGSSMRISNLRNATPWWVPSCLSSSSFIQLLPTQPLTLLAWARASFRRCIFLCRACVPRSRRPRRGRRSCLRRTCPARSSPETWCSEPPAPSPIASLVRPVNVVDYSWCLLLFLSIYRFIDFSCLCYFFCSSGNTKQNARLGLLEDKRRSFSSQIYLEVSFLPHTDASLCFLFPENLSGTHVWKTKLDSVGSILRGTLEVRQNSARLTPRQEHEKSCQSPNS